MPGPSRLVLLLLLATASGGLGAQFLPDIKQFEVENARLILLGPDGKRRGVLKGDLARKLRDGRVQIQGAELSFERDEGSFVIKADEFNYTPASNAFDCPSGVTATLPEGGELELPPGKGELEYAQGVRFRMEATGEAKLRSGAVEDALVDAKITNPAIEVKLTETAKKTASDGKDLTRMALDSIDIRGERGGELYLRLARLPGLGQQDQGGPAVVSVGCFGDVSLSISQAATQAELKMLRRARMALDEEDRHFEVTSNQLSIRGTVERLEHPERSGRPNSLTVLSDVSLDASQNVRLKGDDFEGTASLLRYREFGPRRELRLEGDPSLQLRQGEDQQARPVRIGLRARDYVDVQVPEIRPGKPAPQVLTELSESAHVTRTAGEAVEWQINGRLVRLFSALDEGAGREEVYNHSFDTFAEGYSPLLRIVGMPVAEKPEPGDEQDFKPPAPELQRAAVYGARAEGSIISGVTKVKVHGPEVLGVVNADYPLAWMIRHAVGLRGLGEAPPASPGRMTIRARTLLDLELLSATGAATDVTLLAQGEVELDHTPLPRDDANMLTLTGESVSLRMEGGRLRAAGVEGRADGDALATLGYDLLLCRRMEISEAGQGLLTVLNGPGRVVIRDEHSVEYFRRELDRLPKRPDNGVAPARPDAAWLDFGRAFRADTAELRRTLEADEPDFHLVNGEFELPRAGRTAVNDLAELQDPEVIELYRVSGRRVFATSVKTDREATAVNVLRLEGDAYVDSRLDRITARAAEAIELSGSDNQQADDAPFSAVLLRDAQLQVEEAGVFFGDYVRTGVFSYDGAWTLQAAERLEVTLRPLQSPDADSASLRAARDQLNNALKPGLPAAGRVYHLGEAVEVLSRVTKGRPRPLEPGSDQPWRALDEAKQAEGFMRRALLVEMLGFAGPHPDQAAGLRHARRARALLSALVDVAGQGGVRGIFEAENANVPALTLEMQEALFTFDGLGQVVDVRATGPISVSRGSYTIRGSRLSRNRDGILTLNDASITLPEDTGVEVTGVKTVALKQREEKTVGGPSQLQRTMVTRVSGTDLNVRVKLSRALRDK
ncbi:MAG: hypothetical protein H6841_09240 [Planctomycetes bacterium]|nr:hypothetical protein [Planctomycetota bacterium]MCB9936415.1 hypothetical protein [Planctomycetota bacterium]